MDHTITVGPSAGRSLPGRTVGAADTAGTCLVPAGPGVVGEAVGRSGRKRTHRPVCRSRAVLVRFDDREFAAITAAASRADLSPTAFVGTAAMAAAEGTEAPGAPIREALTELLQARTAAVRIGVAVNKLAAKTLAGAPVTGAELAAAGAAARRSVARVEAAAGVVARRLA